MGADCTRKNIRFDEESLIGNNLKPLFLLFNKEPDNITYIYNFVNPLKVDKINERVSLVKKIVIPSDLYKSISVYLQPN